MEGHLLHPKFTLGLDKNQGNGEVGFLAVNARLVSFTFDFSRAVMEADTSGIGASVCDQIIQHFMSQGRPDGVGKHANVLDLGLAGEMDMTDSPTDAAAKPSEKSPCVWEICELFPELHSHNVIKIRN